MINTILSKNLLSSVIFCVEFSPMAIKIMSMKYCHQEFNEYFRDDTHYLLELNQWKSSNLDIQTKLINEDLFIVATDVFALHLNINRNRLRNALGPASDHNQIFAHWIKENL